MTQGKMVELLGRGGWILDGELEWALRCLEEFIKYSVRHEGNGAPGEPSADRARPCASDCDL